MQKQLHPWRLYLCAMESEAEQIIKHYGLNAYLTNSSRDIGNISRIDLGNNFQKIGNKFKIYVNDHNPGGAMLALTGVGKINSAQALSYLLSIIKPSQIVNVGMCGSLKNQKFNIGDIIRVVHVFQHDVYIPIHHIEFDSLLDKINLDVSKISKEEYGIHFGTLATGDSFIDDEMSRYDLSQIADIVDMEGYSIAKICKDFGINCLMYKIVSDNADESATHNFKNSLEIYNEKLKFLLDNVF